MSTNQSNKFTAATLAAEAKLRRDWISQQTQLNLEGWSEGTIDESWKGRNIENIVGTIQVPVGIAGPIAFNYQNKQYKLHLPLATTEGALVASVNRGCKALSESSQLQVVVEDQGMTRAPVFQVASLTQGQQITAWLKNHLTELQQVVRQKAQESHLSLKSLQPYQHGRSLFVRLVFETGEAMGMNMVTIGSQVIADYLCEKFSITLIALSGNMCSDKKVAAVNSILGRGKAAYAEAVLTEDILKQILKTNAEAFCQTWHHKIVVGSTLAGTTSLNAHAANMVAALFLATGQDLAHVVEASQANLTVELVREGIYVALSMTDIPVGVVGGGTHSQSVQASLALLGLDQVKPGDSQLLAAVVVLAVLAGEVSLLAALSSQDLVQAHQRLGRGK